MTKRSYTQRTLRLLWGLSNARCAYPECDRLLVARATDKDRAAVLGEGAHIIAISEVGPRGDSELSEKDRNDYENLILLCRHHHSLVDGQPNSFTPDQLRGWKNSHEEQVLDLFREEVASIGFSELEVVTQILLGPYEPEAEDFEVLHQEEKLERNGLSESVAILLKIGELRALDVRDFVDHMASVDSGYPERLKRGFVEEYRRLQEAGESGDQLFESLREFASGRSVDMRKQAAGLAVLVYLFDLCEVFER